MNHRRLPFRRPLALALAGALALVAGALLTPGASAQNETLVVGSQTVGLGQDASVKLQAFDIGPPGAAAWLIDITYNAAIVDASSCSVPPKQFAVCNENWLENVVRVAGAEISPLSGDFDLATLGFTCLSVGTSPLTLTVHRFADDTYTDIAVTTSNGAITCSTEVPGDADCSNSVNSLDALFILQFTAGLLGQLPCPNGDVNGDAQSNSLDALLVLQFTVGLIPDLPV